MTKIQVAQQGLNNLKDMVIGVYRHSNLGVFELVLSVNEKYECIDTVFISAFGAIQEGFGIPYKQGQLELFPTGKNMNDMLQNPFEWQEFMNKFKI